MPVFLQLGFKAMCLVNAFRRSLIKQPDMWTIESDRQGRPIVSAGPFRIILVPRPLRATDAIHLYFDDAEVWLPLISRIRLRNAVRLLILRRALERWTADNPDRESSDRNSAPRKRRRTRQTA
jgi:hypothetical protein